MEDLRTLYNAAKRARAHAVYVKHSFPTEHPDYEKVVAFEWGVFDGLYDEYKKRGGKRFLAKW